MDLRILNTSDMTIVGQPFDHEDRAADEAQRLSKETGKGHLVMAIIYRTSGGWDQDNRALWKDAAQKRAKEAAVRSYLDVDEADCYVG